MWNARRLFARLFPNAPANKAEGQARDYIDVCFQLAALLHDIGHCAFSHSIEGVSVGGKALFPPLRELIALWSKEEGISAELKRRWGIVDKELPKVAGHSTHEEIGLLLVEALFQDAEIVAYCEKQGLQPQDIAQDVRAMLTSKCPASNTLDRNLLALLGQLSERKANSDDVRTRGDLLATLRSFISGTLDVDRLDYLARDSHYTGTCYGKCDTEVLINGLSIGWSHDGRLRPALHERAVDALYDMLWSRFQLFQQVLNHKTNVLLNAMLNRAVREAMGDDSVHLKPPQSLTGYIRFTDDLVMSAVFSHCAGGAGKTKAYGRALVHRILPRHLGVVERDPGRTVDEFHEEVEAAKAEVAASLKIEANTVQEWEAKSEIFKNDAVMPWILPKERYGIALPLKTYETTSRLYRSMASSGTGSIPLGMSIKAHLYEYNFE